MTMKPPTRKKVKKLAEVVLFSFFPCHSQIEKTFLEQREGVGSEDVGADCSAIHLPMYE